MALAVTERFPDAAVYAAEPADFDDYGRSLRAGAVQRNAKLAGSICDALLVAEPGAIGFEMNRERLAGGVSASDQQAMAAAGLCYDELRLVVEPSGAVGLAALLAGRVEVAGRTVVVVLSGGNIADDMLTAVGERLSRRPPSVSGQAAGEHCQLAPRLPDQRHAAGGLVALRIGARSVGGDLQRHGDTLQLFSNLLRPKLLAGQPDHGLDPLQCAEHGFRVIGPGAAAVLVEERATRRIGGERPEQVARSRRRRCIRGWSGQS